MRSGESGKEDVSDVYIFKITRIRRMGSDESGKMHAEWAAWFRGRIRNWKQNGSQNMRRFDIFLKPISHISALRNKKSGNDAVKSGSGGNR